jgi:CheY-like chemotaxis protein
MTHDTHCVLIAEDDPAMAQNLASFVASLGMRSRIASTLEEIDQAIAEGGFCCVLLDKQLPVTKGAAAYAATGDTGLAHLRAYDPRRNERDHHLLAIVIVTGVSQKDTFINDNHRRGATSFVAKSELDADRIAGEIQGALDRAGRSDHAACASIEASRASDPRVPSRPPSPDTVPLVLDGVRIGRRTSFLVAGKRRDLVDSFFVVLLRLAAPRARGSQIAVSKADLGILRSPEIPSRIRDEVASALPEHFTFVQRATEGMFRLHPLVTVAPIDWSLFERHGHPGISAFATEQRKLR